MGQVEFLSMTTIMAALTVVSTMVFRIPFVVTSGYFNLGDAMVMTSGLLLGPVGGLVAGGVGSAIADVVGGYAHYAPITLVVKGGEGLVVGLFAYIAGYGRRLSYVEVVGLVLGAVVMLYGYLVAETFLYGFEAALLEAVFVNSIQVVAGGAVAAVVTPPVRRYTMTLG